jgi:hypothetical protein
MSWNSRENKYQRDNGSNRGGNGYGGGRGRDVKDHYGEQYNTSNGGYVEKASNLPINSTPIQKDFYVEHEGTTKRSKEDNEALLKEL